MDLVPLWRDDFSGFRNLQLQEPASQGAGNQQNGVFLGN